jgi:hypothetical protein
LIILDPKKTTALLGIAFIVFLALSYFENLFFFGVLGDFLRNPFLAVATLFVHNVLVVSLILLGMTFYVRLVMLDFFKREKYGRIVLEHPRPFAVTFTVMILLLSIVRASILLYGTLSLMDLPAMLLISAPIGIIEGYGMYLTISKTLGRTMSTKDLAFIYIIFFIAAIIEVGFINLLVTVTAR